MSYKSEFTEVYNYLTAYIKDPDAIFSTIKSDYDWVSPDTKTFDFKWLSDYSYFHNSIYRYNGTSNSVVKLPKEVEVIFSVYHGTNSLCMLSVSNSESSLSFDGCFEGHNEIKQVLFPRGLLSLGNCAFAGCENLTSISIPNKVVEIGIGAFRNCISLKSVTLSNISIIAKCLFDGCKSLESIVIPDSVTEIGDYAFDGCSHLKSITLSDNLNAIGDNAFRGCYNLQHIIVSEDKVYHFIDLFDNSGCCLDSSTFLKLLEFKS